MGTSSAGSKCACLRSVAIPKSVWENLDKNSPALVLSWCHLNNRKHDGGQHRAIRETYGKAGLGDKGLYFSSPKAGREYDLYHLNEIMTFFDKFCK